MRLYWLVKQPTLLVFCSKLFVYFLNALNTLFLIVYRLCTIIFIGIKRMFKLFVWLFCDFLLKVEPLNLITCSICQQYLQNRIGADIIMALDDVVKTTITGPRIEEAMYRTLRWIDRCIAGKYPMSSCGASFFT